MRIFIIASLIITLLSGCIANPTKVTVRNGNEEQLNCQMLAQELRIANQAKMDARKDDEFQWRYLFVFNGLASIVTMWRAENAADKRIALISDLYQQKQCAIRQSYSNRGVASAYPGQSQNNIYQSQRYQPYGTVQQPSSNYQYRPPQAAAVPPTLQRAPIQQQPGYYPAPPVSQQYIQPAPSTYNYPGQSPANNQPFEPELPYGKDVPPFNPEDGQIPQTLQKGQGGSSFAPPAFNPNQLIQPPAPPY